MFTQDHFMKKVLFNWKFWLGVYLVSLEGYLSVTMKIRCWGVANDGISHQMSFKVINQGHVTKKGRFN